MRFQDSKMMITRHICSSHGRLRSRRNGETEISYSEQQCEPYQYRLACKDSEVTAIFAFTVLDGWL